MKIDPNAPAFPNSRQYSNGDIDGLTIRAEIASRVMAGFSANHMMSSQAADWGPENYAAASVKMADALIAELNKSE